MAPGSRLAARLADLSHAQLLEIAAAGCEASTRVRNRADAILAAHKPLAQWAVEGVLLSSDLVPHLMATLQLEDGAAAAVCSRWAEGWKATSEGRRRLRKVAFDFPQELLDTPCLRMAVTPGGDELVVRTGSTARILGRDMSSSGTTFELATERGEIAASEEFIYANMDGPFIHHEIRCFTHAGTEVTKYQMENLQADGGTDYFTLAPGGLLFCNHFDTTGLPKDDEIVALDAQTLQPRHQFGRSLLDCVCGMVVAGEELFVCDKNNDRLQVFSLAGEHRRSITGEWKNPLALCFVKDRLYLIEEFENEKDEEGNLINPLQGRRIFVLSLQGDTLQVYTHPDEGRLFETLCYFDGKLLAPVGHYNQSSRTVEMVALSGA